MLKGKTGIELAARIKAECSAVPIMKISGTEPDSLQNIDCVLHKSELVSAMLAIVHDLVTRSHA